MNIQNISQYYKSASYNKKNENLTYEEWQVALRRQYAENHKFAIQKLNGTTVLADYKVKNPLSSTSYKVAIRGGNYVMDFCECMDFKTNGLGTCKHIEAVLLKSKIAVNSIDKGIDEFGKTYTSVYLKYGKTREVKIRIGTEHRDEFAQLAANYFDNEKVLQPLSYYSFEKFLEEASAIDSSFRCYPDAMEYIIDMRERRKRIQLIEENYRSEKADNKINNLLKTELFNYQKEGVCFAASVGRCLIADDMGLGKTIQALATVELLRKEMKISKVLIVCPTSLKYQWKSEIEKFTSSESIVFEGAQHKRIVQYGSDVFYKIISYHNVGSDIEYISQMEPDLVILDEAQRIKNFKTKISNNVKKIKSDYAIVLTGTPLENKLEELYSIMQFVEPFALGPFYKFLDEHQIKNDLGKVIGYKDLNQISLLLSDVMLRRKKTEVLSQLPERMDKNLLVPMTEKQKELHDVYQSEVAKLISKWQRMGFLNEKDRQRLMINLNLMRMVCDSTYIVDQETRHDTKIDEVMNLLDEFFEQGHEKAVIFSQWERMTRLVAAELTKRGIEFEYLHGGIPSSNRKSLFENFNNKPNCRVFLSTDAGGVGLNLQIASLLINMDIPWNPAVLEQRIARVYRMGQKRNVSIINLVSAGTIEHRMLDVLKFKSSMAEGVLDNGDDSIFMGESRFKTFMNSVEQMVKPSINESESDVVADEEIEVRSANNVSTHETQEKPVENNTPIYSDSVEQIRIEADDVPVANISTSANSVPQKEENELVNMGVSFFSQLSKTLADKDATQKLINSIVAKDETSGQTYLKIPVENEKVVENMLSLFAGLFSAINKQ
jgi:SNF2 family DNA or RNA helicase